MENKSGLTVRTDQVLVILFKVQEKIGSIYIPQATQEKERVAQQLGTLIGWGSEAKEKLEGDDIALGDTVFFQRYRGFDIPIDGIGYWVMKERDILGKCDRLPDFVLRGADSPTEVFGLNNPLAQEAA